MKMEKIARFDEICNTLESLAQNPKHTNIARSIQIFKFGEINTRITAFSASVYYF
jgi:hypothetical protein